MYDNNENGSFKIGINWKDLIIKIIMFVLFILLLVKLFPKVNLDVFYDSVYNNNVKEMKEAARNYYTVDRLPVNVGDKSSMTLKEMFDNNYLIKFTDKNGDSCDDKASKVEVTKLSDKEYSLKVQLTCNDKSDYIIETIGCTSVCSNGTCTTIIDNGNNSNIGTIIDNNGSDTEKDDNNYNGDIKDNNYKVTYTEYQHRKPVYTKIYTCPNGYTKSGTKCTRVNDGVTIDATPIYESDQVVTTDAKVNTTGSYTTYANYIKTEISTEYSCPVGYTKNGAYCIKYTDAKENTERTCPNGYTMSGNSCVKTYGATFDSADSGYYCPNGGTLSGTTCTTTIAANYDYVCPSGYTRNGSSCYKVYSATKNESSNCPSGYTESGSKCIQTYSATNNKSCPSGYTKSGNSCIKTYQAKSDITCPSGYTKSGNSCVKTTDATSSISYGNWINQGTKYETTANAAYTNNTAKLVYEGAITGAQCGAPCGNKGIWYIYTYYTRSANTSYSCPSGYTRNGTKCTATTTGTTSYSCPDGGSRNGTTCTISKNLSDNYTCPNGGTLSGTTCTKTTSKNSETSYTCPNGGTLSGTTCTLTTTATKSNYTCPSGYTKSGSNCIKSYTASYNKGNSRYYCPNGGTLNGTTCTLTTTPDIKVGELTCPSGYTYNKNNGKCEYSINASATKKYSYTCPSGYTKYGEDENTICALEVKGTQEYYCEDAEATLEGTKCIKSVKGKLNGYTCPSGYTLNGTKCTKKNIVTINATESISTTSYKYKWSESSSIEGWEFTGKTRTQTKNYTAGQQ